MADHPLPADVRDLIAHHLPTMEHVEVLLALAAAGAKTRTAGDIATELRGNAASVATRLEDLVASGLVAREGPESDGAFRYAPNSVTLRTATTGLAEMYRTKPVSLVKAIYARPPAAVQSFADAFRVRKPGS
ncbi:MAG: MarR family transcriptional regulator [Gemmatimonadaceae bacterium]|nr:MarR family transcriptional regulator [Gemmatimonadaceae bacterium]NUQ93841.1 MarR family transcriptional regulator [Gemmatimonadaceae bacterium]NUR19049.1 MarR family transcriptional regulator [Gemmatimonadaceae bacterium]NUS96816.1 MarR family transcriptional regulator [Gemmatimonadaceae bacterium]